MKYQITYRQNDGNLRHEKTSLESPGMSIALALANERSDEDLLGIRNERGEIVWGCPPDLFSE